MDTAKRCRTCGEANFDDANRCLKCRRPLVPTDLSYLEDVEALASAVVAAAYDEYESFSLSELGQDGLRQRIVNLGGVLRHWHYDGDGCLPD